MKILDRLWFSNRRGTVGIITIEEDVTGDRKTYIGAVPIVVNEERDTEEIIAWGNKLSLDTIQRIAHFLKKK